MSRVMAAIDMSLAARPVLQAARLLGGLLGASPEAIHVASDGETVADLAQREDVPLRVVKGIPEDVLVQEATADDVVMTVVGARRVGIGRRPAGHVALELVQRSSKPVAVVPPDCFMSTPPRLDRVLIPLDGSRANGLAVAHMACVLADAEPISSSSTRSPTRRCRGC